MRKAFDEPVEETETATNRVNEEGIAHDLEDKAARD